MSRDKFSKPIRADPEAYYMSCPEFVAAHIAKQLFRFKTAVELCCAVGAVPVQLAKTMDMVYGIDIENKRIQDAVYNSKLYGVEKKIKFITGSVLDEKLLKNIKAEVAILDPDWGRECHEKCIHVDNIDETQPSLLKMFALTEKHITNNIVARIPKTFTFETLKVLGPCKIENIIYDDTIRFKLAYFFPEIKINQEVDVSFD